MKLPTLYARSTTGKTTEFTIEVEGDKYRTITGYTDGIKTTSAFTVCKAKSYNTAIEQAIKEATAIHRKKKEAGAFENIADIYNDTFFEPMLAVKYEDRRDKITYPIYSQPKLDGIRCVVKKSGMFTRNGKAIVAAPHIFESLKYIFDELPDIVFDGELYTDKLNNDFNAICSLVKKTKPTEDDLKASKKAIEYHIYDMPSIKSNFSHRNKTILDIHLPDCCKKVDTYLLKNEKEVLEQFDKYIEEGYEGQILRLDGPYENKRSKNLIKHKSFFDDEFEILAVLEGKGKFEGVAAKMSFITKDGKEVDAAINGTMEYLAQIWATKDEFIGKMATVKYFGITPINEKGEGGSLRFPKVISIDRKSYEG